MKTKPNILILSSRFPYPIEKGDKLRLYHQIKSLSKDFNVFLFSISEEKVALKDKKQIEKYVSDLFIQVQPKEQAIWQTIRTVFSSKPFQVGYFYNKGTHRLINQKIKDWKIDKIYCQLIRMAPYCIDVKLPKTIDLMDAMSLGIQNRINSEKGIKKTLFKIEKSRIQKYEQLCLDKFDRSFIISKRDREFLNAKNTLILPNGVDQVYFKPKKLEKTYNIVFVGNMQYAPNIKAAKFLVNDILPLLPETINVLIAGANPTKEIKDLASDTIEISGWMDDIRDAYLQSDLFVAPLFTGAGLQNKILEAMACGIPCITTDLVNKSLKAKENTSILIANNKEEFANQIRNNLNKDLSKISKEALQFVSEKYSWEENNTVLRNILLELKH